MMDRRRGWRAVMRRMHGSDRCDSFSLVDWEGELQLVETELFVAEVMGRSGNMDTARLQQDLVQYRDWLRAQIAPVAARCEGL